MSFTRVPAAAASVRLFKRSGQNGGNTGPHSCIWLIHRPESILMKLGEKKIFDFFSIFLRCDLMFCDISSVQGAVGRGSQTKNHMTQDKIGEKK